MSFSKENPAEPGDLKPRATATVIARDTRLAGELGGSRPLRVEGTFSGTLDLGAGVDVVEGATVEATVRATVVRIAGRVVGDVRASQLVQLLATAVVKGDVYTPALHVVEGATLDGRVQMGPDASAGPEPPPARPAR